MKISVRIIYLYLFALVGLVLIVVGTVRLVDVGLKVFIFKEADVGHPEVPPFPPDAFVIREKPLPAKERLPNVVVKKDVKAVTEEELELLEQWELDYRSWQERQRTYDPRKAERQKNASNSIAMIIVGIPLFIYHWRVIQREKSGIG